MSEKEKVKKTPEEDKEAEAAKEEKPAAEKNQKGEKKPVKEKKDGIFTRAKNWCKRNKKALIAGAAGVGVGVAGTIGVSEYGKRRAEKKARAAYVPEEETYSPLDPNV